MRLDGEKILLRRAHPEAMGRAENLFDGSRALAARMALAMTPAAAIADARQEN